MKPLPCFFENAYIKMEQLNRGRQRYYRNGQRLFPGEGIAPSRELAALLYNAGYRGYLSPTLSCRRSQGFFVWHDYKLWNNPTGNLPSQEAEASNPSACATTAAVSEISTCSSLVPGAMPGPVQPQKMVLSIG